jgi:nitric oxide synthase oxygenase domain/subunit
LKILGPSFGAYKKEVTRLANHLGWKGKGTNFDVLPLIYQLPNESVIIGKSVVTRQN